jgi:hypothetical protein
MKVEIRKSKKKDLPPFTVFIAFEGFRGLIGCEKVFYEGKEVQEDQDFKGVTKIEIIDEKGLESEEDMLYEIPSLYVYLWDKEGKDFMKEEISLPSEPLWRRVKAKAEAVVR